MRKCKVCSGLGNSGRALGTNPVSETCFFILYLYRLPLCLLAYRIRRLFIKSFRLVYINYTEQEASL